MEFLFCLPTTDERGDNLYSVLPSGNLTEDDTHLPSSRLTGQTQEILEEIEESINHPEKIEEIFNNRLVLCDDITSILGKSQKVEDASPVTDKDFQLQTILQNGSFTQDFPPSSPKEATAVSLRIPGTVVEQGQGDFKSRENSFYLESLKKSTLATQEDILSDSIKDPSELITQYLYDDLILNHFPFQETNLTVLPLYVEDETAPNHLDTTVTGEVQIPESPNNIPMFESILSNETEIERLHTKVLLEQLSKTSSNSDLLAAASPSPQFNSGSQGGSSDFNQDHIIQTLMEKPENDSEAPSSSARSESTSNRSRNSSSSAIDESIMNFLEVPTAETSCPSTSTIGGNLPNSILFDFDSSKSKSSESFHTPGEHIPEENEEKVGSEEKVDGEEKDNTDAEKSIKVTREEGEVQASSGQKEKNDGLGQSKMIPLDLQGMDISPHNTMFDNYDQNISDDDLFAVDETPLDSSKSEEETNKTKSGNSLKDSSSLNLSGQESGASQNEAMVAGPIRPFTIEKDPRDPSKQQVVVDTDPSKALYPPTSFKKALPKLDLNLRRSQPKTPKDNTKRFSNPDVGGPYTPLTPQNYYTPQVSARKPFPNYLSTPTSGYVTSSPNSMMKPGPFPSPRSSSPRSQQDEEIGKRDEMSEVKMAHHI